MLEPKNRENLATLIRSGQNFGVNVVFVIGGFIRESYKGSIHKFSHQMDTQSGVSNVTLMYFETLQEFLNHLPAQTTLVIVETIEGAASLPAFQHPQNATYMLGREAKGIMKSEIDIIQAHVKKLSDGIPDEHITTHKKTAHLAYVKIDTPQSLNLGVCASIIMYDRCAKLAIAKPQ
ncbi:TrmH family RNA methyltransferase [Chitinimonas taiwanensis]|uniref:TrmH family RNA methyltransferase n=1 Tax=Chitinimonas taiwanensis TaxID=240412 RepID=UPI0035AE31FC